jgi:hypothetical protein
MLPRRSSHKSHNGFALLLSPLYSFHPQLAKTCCVNIEDFMNQQHSQAFRARNSSEIITIPTRHDPKSGQRVVRWKDIQQYFENAKGVLNGKDAVLFLTDDDLEE